MFLPIYCTASKKFCPGDRGTVVGGVIEYHLYQNKPRPLFVFSLSSCLVPASLPCVCLSPRWLIRQKTVALQ